MCEVFPKGTASFPLKRRRGGNLDETGRRVSETDPQYRGFTLSFPLHQATEGGFMATFKCLSLAAAVAVMGFTAAAPQAQAQAQIGFDIGTEPLCPSGYYDYPPYACAPYGYYGPGWFVGGIFIGAGPWFHGHEGFRGAVGRHFDVDRAYQG